jgi:hypothetical protein
MFGREDLDVKGIMILALLFVAGCSAFVPLEQLEAEALVTGDWSKVEERERMLERRKIRSFLQCPAGTIGYCEQGIRREECTCIDREIANSFLGN